MRLFALALALSALHCASAAQASAVQDAPAQGIDWKPVQITGPSGKKIDARRGLLRVPQSRRVKDGREITLQVGWLRGGGDGPPILYLHGGPGGSATSTVRSANYLAVWESLLPHGDVILLDQRGGGLSKPSLTFRLEEAPARDIFVSRGKFESWLERVSRRQAERLRNEGVEPSAFNNLENMADIEALRRALGVPKLRIVGFSFGSHLGLAYLRRYRKSVDSAVLIGIEGPDHTRKLPSTLDVHWRKLMLRAARDPALAEHREQLAELLPRALAKLEKQSLTVAVRHPRTGAELEYDVGPFGLRFLVMMDLGDSSDIPVLPRLVHEVALGKTEMLRWFLAKRIQLIANLPAVLFTMDAGAGASAGRRVLIREQAETALFANAMNLDYPTAEAHWKPMPLGESYRSPVLSDVRTLFLSGELDSNTPPFQAEQVRWGFADSVHLVAANAGHTASWIGNAKASKAMAAFFAGRDVRNTDVDLPKLRFAPLTGPTDVRHPSLR